MTADDKSKVYGAAYPALTVTCSGFVGGDSAASLGDTLDYSLATTATTTSQRRQLPDHGDARVEPELHGQQGGRGR